MQSLLKAIYISTCANYVLVPPANTNDFNQLTSLIEANVHFYSIFDLGFVLANILSKNMVKCGSNSTYKNFDDVYNNSANFMSAH